MLHREGLFDATSLIDLRRDDTPAGLTNLHKLQCDLGPQPHVVELRFAVTGQFLADSPIGVCSDMDPRYRGAVAGDLDVIVADNCGASSVSHP